VQGQQQQLVPLQALEQQLTDLIGPPHNYVGFPQPAAAATVDEQAPAAASGASFDHEGSKDVAASAAAAGALGLQLHAALGGKAAAAPGTSWLGLDLEQLAAAAEVRCSHAHNSCCIIFIHGVMLVQHESSCLQHVPTVR
jgi:hypothetical protein